MTQNDLVTQDLVLAGWSIVLALVQLGLAGIGKRMQEPRSWGAGPRDDVMSYSGRTARLIRAQSNLMETLPMFLGAVAIAHLAGRNGSLSVLGAELYLAGRVIYVPLYWFGVPYVRTLVWLVATLGLCLVLTDCLS
ncbi:MAPEG family protein [Lichenihabitans psoromatis]|uniref:MAPEG family protein n=1 Tax=Lichenihabitans psoromatis TaxID=2528642 RepID=UPI001FDEB5F4|nr:MAPEG family protein [Lichenihabitans psoromatis]